MIIDKQNGVNIMTNYRLDYNLQTYYFKDKKSVGKKIIKLINSNIKFKFAEIK